MTIVKVGFGSILGAIIGLWQGLPAVLAVLFSLMFFDLLLLVLAQIYTKAVDSTELKQDGIRKTAKIIFLLSILYLEQRLGPDVLPTAGLPVEISSMLAGFFIVVEILSMAESLGMMGVNLPKPLTDILVRLQQTTGGDDKKDKV